MRAEIKVKDVNHGWFAKHQRCVQGSTIQTWLSEHAEADEKKVAILCQQMLERGLLQAVEDPRNMCFSAISLYRFYMDRDDIADNQVKTWQQPAGDPLEVSANLVNLISDVYHQALVEDDAANAAEAIDVEQALKSAEYKIFIAASAELQQVDLRTLTVSQKVAFFLNVYQCMYVHHFLRSVYEQDNEG